MEEIKSEVKSEPIQEESKVQTANLTYVDQEILNVWYEIHYLRFILDKVIEHSQGTKTSYLKEVFDSNTLLQARNFSLGILKQKYPQLNIVGNEEIKTGDHVEKILEQTV